MNERTRTSCARSNSSDDKRSDCRLGFAVICSQATPLICIPFSPLGADAPIVSSVVALTRHSARRRVNRKNAQTSPQSNRQAAAAASAAAVADADNAVMIIADYETNPRINGQPITLLNDCLFDHKISCDLDYFSDHFSGPDRALGQECVCVSECRTITFWPYQGQSGRSRFIITRRTSGPGGSLVFARWRQCAPHQYMLPWAQPSPQPERHLDRFRHFCTAQGRASSGMPGHVLSRYGK